MLDILLITNNRESLLLIGLGVTDFMQAQNLTLVDKSAQWILTRIITEIEVQQLNFKWISQSSVVFI